MSKSLVLRIDSAVGNTYSILPTGGVGAHSLQPGPVLYLIQIRGVAESTLGIGQPYTKTYSLRRWLYSKNCENNVHRAKHRMPETVATCSWF